VLPLVHRASAGGPTETARATQILGNGRPPRQLISHDSGPIQNSASCAVTKLGRGPGIIVCADRFACCLLDASWPHLDLGEVGIPRKTPFELFAAQFRPGSTPTRCCRGRARVAEKQLSAAFSVFSSGPLKRVSDRDRAPPVSHEVSQESDPSRWFTPDTEVMGGFDPFQLKEQPRVRNEDRL